MSQISENQQPKVDIVVNGSRITLLGTAHVSRTSAEMVKEMLQSGDYDAVAVELCPSRYNAMIDPDALARMDLFKVFKQGKALMVAANLALGAYQQRLAEQFGIEPGEEFRVAIRESLQADRPVMLIDREVSITLKRTMGRISWWRRMEIISLLVAGVVTKEEVSEQEIERLKEGDMLESTFAQFAQERQEIFEPLVAERDRYMAARILQEIEQQGPERLLVVMAPGTSKGSRTI